MQEVSAPTLPVIAGMGLLGLCAVCRAADEPPPASLESLIEAPGEEQPLASRTIDAHVTLAVTPRYPKRARKKGVDGEVTVEFDITRFGRARNVEVVHDEPKGVFGREAVDAMKFWAFSPARLADCGTTGQRGRQTLTFRHAEDPPVQLMPLVVDNVPQLPRSTESVSLAKFREQQASAKQATRLTTPRDVVVVERIDPDYPLRALDRNKEGIVSLFFVIEADGSVSDVEVVDAVNGPMFIRPSMRAIKQWRFEPRIRDGRPVPSPACHEFVFHVDEYERSGKLARQRQENNIKAVAPN